MLAFEVLSHSADLSAIYRDAANAWEMDTSVKQPDLLFSRLLGSMAHDWMLKVWILLSLFVICLYDGVKPIENLVNIIIVGCCWMFILIFMIDGQTYHIEERVIEPITRGPSQFYTAIHKFFYP